MRVQALSIRVRARATGPSAVPRYERASPAQAQAGNNPVGVHALVWAGAWEEADVRLAVQSTAKLGYDLLEVPLLQPETVDAVMTKHIMGEFGIKATSSLGLRFDADISSADPEIAARGERLLEMALKASITMGAEYMCGVIYSALGKYPMPPTPEGRRNCVKAMQRIADKASDGGVTLGLEAVNRYETNLLNTAAQAMDFLAEVNRPNVKVHLDTYHMNIEEGDEVAGSGRPQPLAKAVKLCGDSLGYVHIGESNRGYLGTGNIDFDQLFMAMAEINYAGPITFESFSSRVVSPSLSNTLCVWRNLWDDSEDLAKQAKEFIDGKWQHARASRL